MNLFRNYEEEFIVAIAAINQKIDTIQLQTNRTSALTQTRRNWPSPTSRPTSPTAKNTSNSWRQKSQP